MKFFYRKKIMKKQKMLKNLKINFFVIIIFLGINFFMARLSAYDLKNINDILGNNKILNLEEFIAIATKQNPDFEKILINELKLKYNKFLKMQTDQILLDVKTNYYFEDQLDEKSISLSKLFLDQGASVSAGYYDYAYTDRDRDSFVLSVNQSILRNAFGRANRLKISEIELNNRIIKYEIIEAYEEYLAEIIRLYYDWSRVFLNLEIALNDYNYNLKINENIKKKYFNDSRNVDFEKSNIQLFEKQQNLKKLEIEYRKVYNLITQAARIAETENFIPFANLNDIDIDVKNFDIDFLSEYQDFKQNSRTYFIYDLIREKNTKSLQIAQDYNLDNLDLGLSYKDSTKTDYRGVFASVSYQGRFLDAKKNAEIKVAEINYKKTLLDLSIQKYNMHIILKNLYEDLMLQKYLIEICDEKIKKAEIILEEDEKNYNSGKLSVNDLIESMNNLEKYRYEKIEVVTNLKNYLINWKSVTDRLVQTSSVFKDEKQNFDANISVKTEKINGKINEE